MKTKEPDWLELSETPLTDELIAYWQNELRITDQLTRVKPYFMAALNELVQLRAGRDILVSVASEFPNKKISMKKLVQSLGYVDPPPKRPKLPKVTLANLLLALRELPFRSWRNGDILGLFHRNAHFSRVSGKPKVGYVTEEDALTAMTWMTKRYDADFEMYRCIFCGSLHLSRTGDVPS